MKVVKLVYFARLRESLGLSGEDVELQSGIRDVAGLTQWLRDRSEVWARELGPGSAVRVAVNQRMADPGTPVADGDEIAFFPPVTGG